MTKLPLDPNHPIPLVDQIVAGIQQRIEARQLRPGSRVPSIRKFADAHKVSRFTVVEAYDRLVAQGYLASRRGAGFYVTARTAPAEQEWHCPLDRAVDAIWLIRSHVANECLEVKAGSGFLPEDWLDAEAIRRGLRVLAREGGPSLLHYGDPQGYPALRLQLQRTLGERGIAAHPKQIVLTHGGTAALDLIARYLLNPGESVLVDDPGYYILFPDSRVYGATLLRSHFGAQRTAIGTLHRFSSPKVSRSALNLTWLPPNKLVLLPLRAAGICPFLYRCSRVKAQREAKYIGN